MQPRAGPSDPSDREDLAVNAPAPDPSPPDDAAPAEEHFKPSGTIFLLTCYVAVVILLWLSVYLILISRGVTV